MTLQELEARITVVKVKLEKLEKQKEELLDHLIYMKIASVNLFKNPQTDLP